jgi:L-2-hydroxyglutarate oxidase
MSDDVDVVVVGAGIVGLATARALLDQPSVRTVVVVDKEERVAAHQSSHNSGVIHSGIYYRPGSAKATMVAEGRAELLRLCEAAGIAHEVCGKVIVATSDDERVGLDALERRSAEHGISCRRLDRPALAEIEPHVAGVAALHEPSTGIVDFPAVCDALAADITARRGRILLGRAVVAVAERVDGVVVTTDDGEIHARWLVNCAGLHSDRVSEMAGVPTGGVRIMAFRGEYHTLLPDRRHLVRHLVYPVPDPRFPFLGAHFTRTVDGEIHVGPNAVAALAREGYDWRTIDPHELRELLSSRGAWTLARNHWRTGGAEVVRSLSRRAETRALRRLVPDLHADDLVRAPAGVRAQAIGRDGQLLDDFVFAESARVVSVVNAPSPAATACLAIGRSVAARLAARFA